MINILIAYFIAWSTQEVKIDEFYTSRIIYERRYSWQECDFQNYWNYEGTIIRDCKDFFIAYDNKNLRRERHRKTTLLLAIIESRFKNWK